MTHVTFETAKRLKEAGFPRPNPVYGQAWFSKYGFVDITAPIQISRKRKLCTSVRDGSIFAPTATDILAHLPGWALYYHEGVWCCALVEDEFVIAEFRSDNPAEAAAEAFLLEQSHAKK